MNIAMVGCGYVADFYGQSLANYPGLRLVGAFDVDAGHRDAFTRRWGGRAYASLADLIADREVELVLNLTNPRSHFAITKSCLEGGKHVYSEKPLAMTAPDAVALVELARQHDRYLAAAPCSMLSETAQTLWRAVRGGAIGKVRLIYANFDDGMLSNRRPWTWMNESGVHWPAQDEFEVGCTFEHAGYLLTWLGAMFGPAVRVTAFAACQIPDKGIAVETMAPDFTTGAIEYGDGIVARVTCGLVAPHDKSLMIVGDTGVLFVGNVRNDAGPVMLRRQVAGAWQSRLAGRLEWLQQWLEERLPGAALDALLARRVPLVRAPHGRMAAAGKPVDFMRGPAELADAVREQRPARLTAPFAAHIVDLVERLQYPGRFIGRESVTTSFAPIAPMPWAR